MPDRGSAAATNAPFNCPEWCEGGPHGAPPCHTRALETIVLKDGIIRVSLTQQEPLDKGPKISVIFHAHGDGYNKIFAATVDVYDAQVIGAALAAMDRGEGKVAHADALLGSGGALAHAFAKGAMEVGLRIPVTCAGRGSGRGRKPQVTTLRGLIAEWWKARR